MRRLRTEQETTLQYSAEQLYSDLNIENASYRDKIEAMVQSTGLLPFGDVAREIDNSCNAEGLADFERRYESGELHDTAERIIQLVTIMSQYDM
ncbi:MAG: hypothetical protein JXC85_04110 [Candidatus Aenigmarchaeota archaeon]|nr:hypothetical protein [Candidatus Aenigmarchaeota archaeon]